MKIIFNNVNKIITEADLKQDYLLAMRVPAEVLTAVKAGKEVWYSSCASLQDINSSHNANKKIRLSSAGKKQFLGMADNSTLSHICSAEKVFENPNHTVLSGDAATFTMNVVAGDEIYFTARRLEALEPSDNMNFYATANFFIPA